jgi:hypothetical protein
MSGSGEATALATTVNDRRAAERGQAGSERTERSEGHERMPKAGTA